jgi:replicative DNA helicase
MLTQIQIINLILSTGDYSFILDNNLSSDYFPDLRKEFNFINKHYFTYNQVPDQATFLKNFPEFEIIQVNESEEYLLNEIYREHNEKFLVSTFNKIRGLLMDGKTDEAMNLLSSSADNAISNKKMDAIDILSDVSRYDSYIEKCHDFNKYYVTTGFRELDMALGGGIDRQNSYFVISARAGIGKTLIMVKFAAAAVKAGLKVGMYEGEMTVDKIAGRYDTLVSHISNSAITHGNIGISNMYKSYLDNLSSSGQKGKFYILTRDMVPDNKVTVNTLRSFVEKYDLDMLFVDQLSLLDTDSHYRQSFEQMAEISKALKNLQVQKRIPIVVASQQNRSSLENNELAGTQNLSLSDRIGQDATEVIFLSKNDNLMKINIAKARDGYTKNLLSYVVNFDTGTFEYAPEEDEEESEAESNKQDNNKNLGERVF